jgi:heme oxygenase (biliverdin-IX-beta and delta-forming)
MSETVVVATEQDASARKLSRLQQALRAETAELHQALEERLDLLGPGLTLERYAGVIAAFFGYYEPLETKLEMLEALVGPAGVGLCRRHLLLERDLVALGFCDGPLRARRCSELPTLSRREHLVGCLYVLEGACLGGQVIARALKSRLGLGPRQGAAFFTGDGAGTRGRWNAFSSWLCDEEQAGAVSEEVVVAARDTFGTLTRWLEDQRALR